MQDLTITIDNETRKAEINKDFAGVSGEHLQNNIVVKFNEFVSGTAYFEVIIDQKYFLEMTKDETNQQYTLPIKNSLLKQSGFLTCQIVINGNDSNIPVFKSRLFKIRVLEAINAKQGIEDDYPQWADGVDQQLATLQEKVQALCDNDGYVHSLTPDATENSDIVATTQWVNSKFDSDACSDPTTGEVFSDGLLTITNI